MTDNLNNTSVSDLGHKAAAAWDRSSSNGDAGDALAINALFIAAHTMTFSASVERKGSDIAETIDFDFRTWMAPCFNADGSKDVKAMAARTLAVADKVFGMTELTNAIKQRIERAKAVAWYLYSNIDADKLGDVTMKGNKLVVPYCLVHKTPAADASDNVVAMYDAMRNKPCTLDGKGGASLAELGKRARPERDVQHKQAGAQIDPAVSFNQSLRLVAAIIFQHTSEESEGTDIALNNDQRRHLFDLHVALGRYFTDDPIEDEQRKAA